MPGKTACSKQALVVVLVAVHCTRAFPLSASTLPAGMHPSNAHTLHATPTSTPVQAFSAGRPGACPVPTSLAQRRESSSSSSSIKAPRSPQARLYAPTCTHPVTSSGQQEMWRTRAWPLWPETRPCPPTAGITNWSCKATTNRHTLPAAGACSQQLQSIRQRHGQRPPSSSLHTSQVQPPDRMLG